MGQLTTCRNNLNAILAPRNGADFPNAVRENWPRVEGLIREWWAAYKAWERKDNFNKAVGDDRMTVRTFPANFDREKFKNFDSINVTIDRFFADNNYTPLEPNVKQERSTAFHGNPEHNKYTAKRGIDSSAFAKPESFRTRETKYAAGLHDLSASLINRNLSIFKQIHNTGTGAHFSFLPLSKQEDQAVLYGLIRAAKVLKIEVSALYNLVRDYRAEMTRVKLANEFDMAVGYSAVHAPTLTGRGPQFKLRYGLGDKTTEVGVQGNVTVTAELYQARQQSAINFKSILGIRDAKNEVIIAIRKHAGNFPVYAVRNGEVLDCYTINGGKMVKNGTTISDMSVMT